MSEPQPSPWVSARQVRLKLQIGPTRFARIRDTLPIRRLSLPGCRTLYHREDLEEMVRWCVWQPEMSGRAG